MGKKRKLSPKQKAGLAAMRQKNSKHTQKAAEKPAAVCAVFAKANKLAEAAQLRHAKKALPASLLSPRGRKKGTKDSKRKSREVSPQKDLEATPQRSKKSPSALSYSADSIRQHGTHKDPDRSHIDCPREKRKMEAAKLDDLAAAIQGKDNENIAKFLLQLGVAGKTSEASEEDLEATAKAINDGEQLAVDYDNLLRANRELQEENEMQQQEIVELKMSAITPRYV